MKLTKEEIENILKSDAWQIIEKNCKARVNGLYKRLLQVDPKNHLEMVEILAEIKVYTQIVNTPNLLFFYSQAESDKMADTDKSGIKVGG